MAELRRLTFELCDALETDDHDRQVAALIALYEWRERDRWRRRLLRRRNGART